MRHLWSLVCFARGGGCTAWSSMRRYGWRLSMRVEPPRGGAAVRHRPPDGEEDAALCVAAGLSPDEAGTAAEAGRIHRQRNHHQPDRQRRPRPASQPRRARTPQGRPGPHPGGGGGAAALRLAVASDVPARPCRLRGERLPDPPARQHRAPARRGQPGTRTPSRRRTASMSSGGAWPFLLA